MCYVLRCPGRVSAKTSTVCLFACLLIYLFMDGGLVSLECDVLRQATRQPHSVWVTLEDSNLILLIIFSQYFYGD